MMIKSCKVKGDQIEIVLGTISMMFDNQIILKIYIKSISQILRDSIYCLPSYLESCG